MSKEEGMKKAEQYGINYYENSVKMNINVFEIISDMVFNECIKLEGYSQLLLLKQYKGIALFTNQKKSKHRKAKCY